MNKKIYVLMLASMLSATTAFAEDLLAFPGAQGWGRFATRGRK